MAAGRRMSMERKYDGEYCQIHIDISKKNDGWLKIFSKSGRDSTYDRMRVHEYVSPITLKIQIRIMVSHSMGHLTEFGKRIALSERP